MKKIILSFLFFFAFFPFSNASFDGSYDYGGTRNLTVSNGGTTVTWSDSSNSGYNQHTYSLPIESATCFDSSFCMVYFDLGNGIYNHFYHRYDGTVSGQQTTAITDLNEYICDSSIFNFCSSGSFARLVGSQYFMSAGGGLGIYNGSNGPFATSGDTWIDKFYYNDIVYPLPGPSFGDNLFFQGSNLGFSFTGLNTDLEGNYTFSYRNISNSGSWISTNLFSPLYTGISPFSDKTYIFNQTLVPENDYEVKILFTPTSLVLLPYESSSFLFTTLEDEFYVPVIPDVIDWNFFLSSMTFFENGFSLDNFVPSPYGGELSFEIISPSGSGVITETFLSYENDGAGYGFDSIVSVTYPYHVEAGEYQVRTLYSYNGELVYPFGIGYNTYIISLPEIPITGDDISFDVAVCGGDGSDEGFLPGVSNFFNCLSSYISGFFKAIVSLVEYLKDFIVSISSLGDVDEYSTITFNFIPTASAYSGEILVEAMFDSPSNQESFVKSFSDFLTSFVLGIVFLTLLLFLILSIKNK